MMVFDRRLESGEADCYAKDYEESYCGEASTTPEPTTTATTTGALTLFPTTTTTTTSTTTTAAECEKTIEEAKKVCLEHFTWPHKLGYGHEIVCDCYTFTQCWNQGQGHSAPMECPKGTIFDHKIGYCNHLIYVAECDECQCQQEAIDALENDQSG